MGAVIEGWSVRKRGVVEVVGLREVVGCLGEGGVVMIVRPRCIHSIQTKGKKKTQSFFVVSFLGVVSAGVVAVDLVVSSSSSLVAGW
jgi:acyl-CoA synthetase (AMP-forming)/AMP-acid ligase II